MKNLNAKAFQIAQIGDSAVEVRYLAAHVPPVAQAEVTRHLQMTLRDRFDVPIPVRSNSDECGWKAAAYKREWPA